MLDTPLISPSPPPPSPPPPPHPPPSPPSLETWDGGRKAQVRVGAEIRHFDLSRFATDLGEACPHQTG